MSRYLLPLVLLSLLVVSCLLGCSSSPARPAATAVPPAATPLPPTATSVSPTVTPVPTDTHVPPTATPIPPTATLVPPTSTPLLPTATIMPPATYTASPTQTPAKSVADPKLGIVRGRIEEGGTRSLILIPETDGGFKFTISDRTPQTTSSADGRFEFVSVPPALYLLVSPNPDGGGYTMVGTTSKKDLIVNHVIMANGPAVYEVKAGSTTDLGDLPAALRMK